jgi:hypothetical protein
MTPEQQVLTLETCKLMKAKNTDIEEQIVLVTAIYIFICSWFIWTTYFTILYFLR